jgi:hypothetical protein
MGLLLLIAIVFLALLPLAAPLAALAPKRFIQRLFAKHASVARLEKNINLLVLVVVVFVATSYAIGYARFQRLAQDHPVAIDSTMYSGKAIVLAQTDTSTLVMERPQRGTHQRFILFRDGFIASEMVPWDSNEFEPLPKAGTQSSVNVVNATATGLTSEEHTCQAQCKR